MNIINNTFNISHIWQYLNSKWWTTLKIIQKKRKERKMVEKLIMGKKQQLLLLLILVVELQLQGYNINGCSEKERIGLLGLKDFFTKHKLSMDPLTSWSGSSNCCQWSGVQCHPVSALTIDLSLTTLLNNDDSIHPLIYFFDASLLRPFHKLESLDLSYNGFSGFTNHQCNIKLFYVSVLITILFSESNVYQFNFQK